MPQINRKTGEENWSHGARPIAERVTFQRALINEALMLHAINPNDMLIEHLNALAEQLSLASIERIERDLRG